MANEKNLAELLRSVEQLTPEQTARVTLANEAIAKGIEVDDQGVPQADPRAVRNFSPNDFVKFDGGKRTGILIAFSPDGFAVVESDGNDYKVDAADLRDAIEEVQIESI